MIQDVNIYLTIAVMLPIIVGGYLVVKIKKYVEKSFKRSQEMFTQMSEYVQESTDSIKTTKAYACENDQLKEYSRNIFKFTKNKSKFMFWNMLFNITIIWF